MTAKPTNSAASKRQAISSKTPTTLTAISDTLNNLPKLSVSNSSTNFSSKKTFAPIPAISGLPPKQKTLNEVINSYNKSKTPHERNLGAIPKAKPIVSPTIKAPPVNPTSDYKFNLPPHQWSLPLEPDVIAPDTVIHRVDDVTSSRRGKIWYYNGYVGPSSKPDYQNTGIYTPPDGVGGTDNKYGFQFIWNPETFSQNTAVNMSITPSAADPTIALTGFAAANSTMSFTLRLDRTNDFACAKNFVFKDGTFTVPGGGPTVNNGNFTSVSKYYNFGSKYVDGFTVEQNIKDLLTYGTEADLEFLYRTINGTGWKGIGGRETSNIGYLMPALIRLDLGNQKFVGVVSGIQVNHLAFTRDLVPIRTDVNITVDLRANIQPTTNSGAVGR